MYRSAELIDSLRFVRSRNYYNDPGIYGVTTLTYRHVEEITNKPTIKENEIMFEVFIQILFIFYI